jgi:hypothetical protein
MMTHTMNEIARNKQLISQLQAQVVSRDQECRGLEEELQLYKEINEQEQVRVEVKCGELQLQQNVIQAEVLCINDDYKT